MKEIGSDPFNRVSASDDITRRKHGGADTSIAAWCRARHNAVKSQMAIIEVLEQYWPAGLTAKEIAHIMEKPFNAMSGRCTELLEQSMIVKTDERRGGGRVLALSYTPAGALGSSLPHDKLPSLPVRTRAEIRAEISRLVEIDQITEALDLAMIHNIRLRLELDVTV